MLTFKQIWIAPKQSQDFRLSQDISASRHSECGAQSEMILLVKDVPHDIPTITETKLSQGFLEWYVRK